MEESFKQKYDLFCPCSCLGGMGHDGEKSVKVAIDFNKGRKDRRNISCKISGDSY